MNVKTDTQLKKQKANANTFRHTTSCAYVKNTQSDKTQTKAHNYTYLKNREKTPSRPHKHEKTHTKTKTIKRSDKPDEKDKQTHKSHT